jgi:hypothetical protein
MTTEEFDELRGVTTARRTDASLYARPLASQDAAAAAGAGGDGGAGDGAEPAKAKAGEAKKGAGARAASEQMFYRITCKVSMCVCSCVSCL